MPAVGHLIRQDRSNGSAEGWSGTPGAESSSVQERLPGCAANFHERLNTTITRNVNNFDEQQNCTQQVSVGEPYYEFIPEFGTGRPIPLETLFKSLALAFDYANVVWSATGGQESFISPSTYGLEISVASSNGQPIPAKGLMFLLETIAFWMREEDKFMEMKATVTNHGTAILRLDVRLPPSISPDPFLGAIVGPLTTTNDTRYASEGSGSQPLTSRGSPLTLSDRSLYQRGNSHNTFLPDFSSHIMATTEIGGDEQQELDLMSNLMWLARLALTDLRVKHYKAYLPPDHTYTIVVPSEARMRVFGKPVTESLVDLIEWEYVQFHQTGKFWCTHMVIRQQLRAGWRDVSELRIVWT